jgi:CRP-like cAMP-binding protein
LGLTRSTYDATVHIAGDGVGHALSVNAFRRELDQRGALFRYVTHYAHALVGFVTQSVACNALHSAHARCCRWLLHAQDRLASHDLPLTHELLSTTLGARRPTVTLILADLARRDIISKGRGVIRITDRTALEARSCECYRTVRTLFDNLLPFEASQRRQEEESWQEPVALRT